MNSHDPFGYLKHKLWPKERPWIKLLIWPLTTKSQKLPIFPCVQVVCYIPLESSQQGLQLFFKPHLNERSAHKIIDLQSCRNLNFENFGTSNLRVSGQNDTWVMTPWPCKENTIMGKVVVSPQSGLWWVLWVRVCPWFVHATKVLQLCINQFIVWFEHVHVNNWPACHST